MVKIRDENINTEEYWDYLHNKSKVHNSQIPQQMIRFFNFGYIPKDEECSVLDIGCGDAFYVRDLEEQIPLVKWYGLDFSSVVTERNREGNPKGIFFDSNIDTEDIPGTFDYIVSLHSFEHFDFPVQVLQKCIKAARKKVIICVPYEDAWSTSPEHVHKFTLDSPWTNYSEYKLVGPQSQEIFYVFEGEADD